VLKKDLYWTSHHHKYSSLGKVCELVEKIESVHASNFVMNYYLFRGRLQDSSLIMKIKSYAGLIA
jgi:hypothetical protein